jgi:hypothetical protein
MMDLPLPESKQVITDKLKEEYIESEHVYNALGAEEPTMYKKELRNCELQ